MAVDPRAVPDTPPLVHVAADPVADRALRDRADALAKALGLPAVHYPPADADGQLVVTPERLELRWGPLPGEDHHRTHPVYVDLLAVDTQSGPGRSLRQPLAVAVGLTRQRRGRSATPATDSGDGDGSPRGPLHVLDATGGLGEDAWLLAGLGCRVEVCERNPVVAALLADGLRRAAAEQPDTAGRVTVTPTDARTRLRALPQSGQRPDVVYLDPMFPPRRGGAAERRPMRVLRRLVGTDGDASDLLAVALTVARRRVVVKRPRLADPLVSDRAPDLTPSGKALRYDVYLTAR